MKYLFMCLVALSFFSFADTNEVKWILAAIAFTLVAIFLKLNEDTNKTNSKDNEEDKTL